MAGKTILIVDPEQVWLDELTGLWDKKELQDIRGGLEFNVIAVTNYNDALHELEKQEFLHVLITEINLDSAGIDEKGLNLINYVRSNRPHTKVIVLYRFITIKIATILGMDYGLEPENIIAKREQVTTDYFYSPREFLVKIINTANLADESRQISGPDIFVAMPFADNYQPVFLYIQEVAGTMKKACGTAGQRLARGTDDDIMKDIRYGIQNADIIVAELSGNNPNVYFEVGLSYAWHKKVVLIAEEGEKGKIPDILSRHRIVYYQAKWGKDIALKTLLSERLKAEFSDKDKPKNTSALLIPNMCFVITSRTRDGRLIYNNLIKDIVDKTRMDSLYLWDKLAWHTLDDSENNRPVLIESKLKDACVVIADLSENDPTAFYLAGLVVGLAKKYMFLYCEDEKEQDIPFDISHLSLLRYSKSELEEARNILYSVLQSLSERCRGESAQEPDSNTGTHLESLQEGSTEKMLSKVKVFLNHATEDKPLVRKLYAELKKYPWIDPWIDEERLLPGQELELEIDKAMKESDAVLVCISSTSVKKTGYVQKEIRKAEEQQDLRPRGVIYMIPVLLESCKEQVPPNLQSLFWVDISNPTNINSIIKSLKTLRK